MSVMVSDSAVGRSNCDVFEVHAAGLDLRQVEHVVDEMTDDGCLLGIDALVGAGGREPSRTRACCSDASA